MIGATYIVIRKNGSDVRLDVGTGDSPDLLVALTFSRSEVSEPGTIDGDRSTRVTLPRTTGNDVALGATIGSELTRTFPCRVFHGGQEHFRGSLHVRGRTRDGFEVVLRGSNAVWYSDVEDIQIRELDLGTLDVTETAARDSWDGEGTYLFGLVNYGEFHNRTSAYNITVDQLRPAVSVDSVFRKIMEATGRPVTVSPRVTDIFRRLWMPYTEGDDALVLDDAQRERYSTYLRQAVSPPVPLTGTAVNIQPTQVVEDIGNNYVAPGQWSCAIDCVADIEVRVFLNALVGIYWQVFNYTDGQLVAQRNATQLGGGPSYPTKVVFDGLNLEAGKTYGIRIVKPGYQSNTTINLTDLFVDFVVQSANYQTGVTYPVARFLPNWTGDEFIAGLSALLNLRFDTDVVTGEVKVAREDDLFTWDPSTADDWTSLSDLTGGFVVKPVDGLAKRTQFIFDNDDSDRAIIELREKYRVEPGCAEVVLSDEFLTDVEEVEVPWSYTHEGEIFTDQPIRVPELYSEDYNFDQVPSFEFAPRILVFDGLKPGRWTFHGSTEDSYPRMFFRPTSDLPTLLSLDFGQWQDAPGLILDGYRERVAIWESGAVVETTLRLRGRHVNGLRFDTPKTITDDNGLPLTTYLDKVDQYVPGEQSTEVRLLLRGATLPTIRPITYRKER